MVWLLGAGADLDVNHGIYKGIVPRSAAILAVKEYRAKALEGERECPSKLSETLWFVRVLRAIRGICRRDE